MPSTACDGHTESYTLGAAAAVAVAVLLRYGEGQQQAFQPPEVQGARACARWRAGRGADVVEQLVVLAAEQHAEACGE